MSTIKDWVDKFCIEQAASQKDDDVMMIIEDSDSHFFFVGNFLDVPKKLFELEIVDVSIIVDSISSKRIGAYFFRVFLSNKDFSFYE